MVSSAVYPGLERKPGGPDNWVERAKGLPKYIERIAKHLHYEKGMSISHAIATAVNTVKRWARGGTVTKYGTTKRITPKTMALAAAAVASWNAKKIAGRINLSEIDLSLEFDEIVAFDLLREFQETIDLAETKSHLKPQTCKYCKAPATKSVLHSEGMAYIPACAAHLGKAKTDAAACVPFGKPDPGNINKVYDLTESQTTGARSTRHGTLRTNIAVARDSMDLDMASTIAPRKPSGRATDGRRKYKRQGKWGHGFVPLDRAAKESKAKGSPIAIKRLDRLYAGGKRTQGAGTGRTGSRSGGGRKDNSQTPSIDEKGVKEKAQTIGKLRSAHFDPETRRKQSVQGTIQHSTSKQTRIPKRAKQNWDEIPDSLKTVRDGKKYVLAVFGGKNVLTEWVGGINEISSDPDKTKTMREIAPAELAKMTPTQIRKMLKNPRTPNHVRASLNKTLRSRLSKAANRG